MAGKRHVDKHTDRAIKSNNWDEAKAAAKKDLKKANAILLNDEKQRSRRGRNSWTPEGCLGKGRIIRIEVKVPAQEYLTVQLDEDLDEPDQEDRARPWIG